MKLTRLLLGSTAILTLGIFAAACSGGGGGGGSHKLESGDYSFTPDSTTPVTGDTCFDAGTESALTGVIGGVTLTIVSTNGTTWVLVPPSIAQGFLPPIAGTIDGNNLAATGNVALDATSACNLAISGTIAGVLTADDIFNTDLTLGIDANTTASNGLASNCSSLAGTTIPGTGGLLPFPTLSNPTNGNCALTLHGVTAIQ